MFVLVIRQREVGVPLIPFNALTGHRPALQRLPRAWHQTRAEHGVGFGRLSDGCDLPSTGNWDSGNPAFALSRGSHDGPPSTSSRCPSPAWHAVVPFTFRIQVSQQTQEPPSEFLPAEPGIQPGASWRTATGQRPGPRRAPVAGALGVGAGCGNPDVPGLASNNAGPAGGGRVAPGAALTRPRTGLASPLLWASGPGPQSCTASSVWVRRVHLERHFVAFALQLPPCLLDRLGQVLSLQVAVRAAARLL